MSLGPSPITVVLTQIRQRAASVLVLLAMAIQALVPAGYMLGARPGDGAIAITLCSSDGMISAFIDANGQIRETKSGSHSPGQDTDDTSPVCSFVGQGTGIIAPAQLPLMRSALVYEKEAGAKLHVTLVPGLGLAAPPPPKTGPPIQV